MDEWFKRLYVLIPPHGMDVDSVMIDSLEDKASLAVWEQMLPKMFVQIIDIFLFVLDQIHHVSQ